MSIRQAVYSHLGLCLAYGALYEVYDVMNFYKHHGWAQSLARSMRFERVTLFVICSSTKFV